MAEEGGPEKWQQLQVWLNTPPAPRPSPVPGRAVPRRVSEMEARARAAVGDMGSAFAALEQAQAR